MLLILFGSGQVMPLVMPPCQPSSMMYQMSHRSLKPFVLAMSAKERTFASVQRGPNRYHESIIIGGFRQNTFPGGTAVTRPAPFNCFCALARPPAARFNEPN